MGLQRLRLDNLREKEQGSTQVIFADYPREASAIARTPIKLRAHCKAFLMTGADSPQLAAAMADWRTLLGSDQVDDANQAVLRYGFDTTGAKRQLLAALRLPRGMEHDAQKHADSVDALVANVLAVARKHRLAIHPLSTGRNWGYGTALPNADSAVLLDLGALQRIEFDAELGVVTLEPGVSQGQLAAYLKRHGLPYMTPTTGAGPSCSVLGNALERGYGITPVIDHFAAVTDLEAVMADGTRYRSTLREAAKTPELARLFKWGVGPHAQGLFTQSGLGVVTRMSIALARRPECVQVCLFALDAEEQLEPSVLAIQQLMRRLPGVIGGINLMNRHRVLAMLERYPESEQLDQGLVSKEWLDAMSTKHKIPCWTGLVTMYGTQSMVATAQAEIRRSLRTVRLKELRFLSHRRVQLLLQVLRWTPPPLSALLGVDLTKKLRSLRRTLSLARGVPNQVALPLAYWRRRGPLQQRRRDPGREQCGLIWYAPLVPMRADDVRRYVELVHRVTTAHRIEPLITFTTLGDRLFDSTVPILFDARSADATSDAQRCAAALLTEGREAGFFPYRFGVDSLQALRDLAPQASMWHQRLRRTWDANDTLAPGRYC